MAKREQRVAIEIRLPVALGREALRERAQALQQCGFRWDKTSPPQAQPAGRDEIGADNPTDRTYLLWGWTDQESRLRLEAEPDIVAIWETQDTSSALSGRWKPG